MSRVAHQYQYPSLSLLNKDSDTTQYQVAHETTELMRPVGWTKVVSAPPMIKTSQPCSICVRLTSGHFLEYDRTSLLHCGISNADGQVHHFDENGHGCDVWRECVSIALHVPNVTDWNRALDAFHSNHQDHEGMLYHEDTNNCFDYVVRCLQELNANFVVPLRLRNASRHTVEKYYVRPSILAMEKYLQLLSVIQQRDNKEEKSSNTLMVSIVELFHSYVVQLQRLVEVK
jgi:hypothetical protein